jgi:hypothetical protein
MDLEQASFLGLIGSGLSVAAFFGLTLAGILFVWLLDLIEGHCARIAMRWRKAKVISSSLGYSAVDARDAWRAARLRAPIADAVSDH